MAQINYTDLDGDAFVLNNTGEAYTRIAKHLVMIPRGAGAPAAAAQALHVPVALQTNTPFPAAEAMDNGAKTAFLVANWNYFTGTLARPTIEISARQTLDICMLTIEYQN